MKKLICLLLAALMLLGLCACSQKTAEPEPTPAPVQEVTEWTRQGYYSDENEDFLSVTWMDDIDEPGWYVGFMNGEDFIEDSYGGTLPQEGSALHGVLASGGSKGDITVTVTEEGEDGLQVAVEGGETYHLKPMEMETATIFVTINTEGWGNIAYAEGEETPEIDPEYPYQSAVINLAAPAVHTFVAWPQAGNVFVKWTRNGEDYSTEPQITVSLDESADFIAVFEEDPDWQNPVMNFVGEYQCGRAHALVECSGYEDAWITIEWGGSAWELARWNIFGRLDLDTLTVSYSGCSKQIVVYDDSGEVVSEEAEYEDGSGTIVFHDDGTFTWHEDQSETGEDMLFEWLPVAEWNGGAQIANPWRESTEEEAKTLCPASFAVPEGAENAWWTVMDSAADPSGVPGPLFQLTFDLDGNTFTAREQVTGGEEIEQSGMYYEWTAKRDEMLTNWPGAACRSYRWIGEDGYADLCTWYDAANGVSYSLSVTAENLDGFDLLAVAEAMHP